MSKQTTKVLVVAPSAYPLGGVQTWLDYLIPGLNNNGISTMLALTEGQHHHVDTYLATHPFSHVLRMQNFTGSIKGRLEAIERTVLNVDPDIVLVVNLVDVYPAINNLRARGLTDARVVSTLHGIHPGLIASINDYAETIDAVISTNRLTQQLINSKTALTEDRSLYAPYGVDKADTHTPKTHTQPDQRMTIAYVGRLEEDQKRISDLISIIQRLQKSDLPFRLLIAGDGDELNAVQQAIQSLNCEAHVQYLGVLSPDQLVTDVYHQSDVLLLTSHWETGPIVAWEAMSHGVLFVSSRYIGHREEGSLVDGQNCLLFDIGDLEQAMEKIQLATDVSRRDHLVKNAHSLIEQRYTQSKSIEQWRKCLDKIMQRPARLHAPASPVPLDKGKFSDIATRLMGYRGTDFAERIRRIANIQFHHTSAGSEWPHCYDDVAISASKYLQNYVQPKDGN